MFINSLLLLVPISAVLAYAVHAPPLWVFVTGALAIVPLAEWMRRATDQLSKLAGPTVGGLLSVSFGNAPELILGLFLLADGHAVVVKGQITGAIIGNGLLGLGIAVLVGTWGRDKQTFDRHQSGQLSSLLVLAVIALLVPALYDYAQRGGRGRTDASVLEEHLSLGVSCVLILVYAANLLHTLVTHRDVFTHEEAHEQPEWSLWKALAVLLAATLGAALESELVSGALEGTAGKLGLSPFFLGVIVLAVIGNAAEYAAAVYFARQGRMSLTLSITVGSTIQIALLVAPALVLLSWFTSHPLDLVFANPLEMIAIASVALVVNAIAHDGEVNWFEGLLLVSVYVILGLAFFFVAP